MLTISSIFIIIAIFLIPIAGILQLKIHKLMGIDSADLDFKPIGFWGYEYFERIFDQRKEVLKDSVVLNKIRLYKIIIRAIYFCLFLGIGMFVIIIIQNQK